MYSQFVEHEQGVWSENGALGYIMQELLAIRDILGGQAAILGQNSGVPLNGLIGLA